MALILRIDVDKPYGRKNLKQKILSKLREDLWFPPFSLLGYLRDLRNILYFLDEFAINAHLFFRTCTLPKKKYLNGPLLDKHQLGLHAENTRSLESFKRELRYVQKYFEPRKICSFTKHGSGNWKGGRNHYPSYEPDKYLEWGNDVGVPFLFGNLEDFAETCEPHKVNHFYPGAFWIDRPYTNLEYFDLKKVIEKAKVRNIVVIMHSGCFEVDRRIEEAMKRLIIIARDQNVEWITL